MQPEAADVPHPLPSDNTGTGPYGNPVREGPGPQKVLGTLGPSVLHGALDPWCTSGLPDASGVTTALRLSFGSLRLTPARLGSVRLAPARCGSPGPRRQPPLSPRYCSDRAAHHRRALTSAAPRSRPVFGWAEVNRRSWGWGRPSVVRTTCPAPSPCSFPGLCPPSRHSRNGSRDPAAP